MSSLALMRALESAPLRYDAGMRLLTLGRVDRLHSIVAEAAAAAPGGRVLEIGCGTGAVTARLVSLGARVTVTTASGSQMQEVCLGTWYLSQGPTTLHFGLGQDFTVTAIDVAWPGLGGVTSRIVDVAADQRLEIAHP